jgi:hypothetical protein
MQLKLKFLELEPLPPLPQPATGNIEEEKEIRNAALQILARMIAQAANTEERTMEACDE